MNSDREWLWYQLLSIPGIGVRSASRLLEAAGDIEGVMSFTPQEFASLNICSKKAVDGYADLYHNREALYKSRCDAFKKGIRFISIEHPDFPEKLKELSDCPYGLWYLGKLPDPKKPSAAIIGSRGCTQNGMDMAYRLGFELSKLGVCVISGMAVGIDASAQWGTLENGGYSLGVLGGGADVCYPRENLDLYQELCVNGGIMSESTLGTPPVAGLFRLRNRLISGMADCVVVVEAREKSGTQITVNCALDQGREVFALPGRPSDPLSRGCNQMISQGARILWDFDELAEFFGLGKNIIKPERKNIILTDAEKMVFNCLGSEPIHLEDILTDTCLPVGELMQILLHLEIKGAIHQQIKNYYKKSCDIF